MASTININSFLILSLIFVTLCDQIICKRQLPESVTMQKIAIPLDHFDVNNNEVWNLTYLENKKYCAPNGPIFVLAQLDDRYLTEGQFHDLAAKNNGCLFNMRIRFYAQDFPVNYLAKLELLNVEQIIEDIAYFVDEIKLRNPELDNSKIIFGGSDLYGSFVVWFKQKYPDMVDAGWVSNAPIEAKMDTPDLNNVIGDLIREVGGNQCYKKVHNGMNHLSKLLEEGSGDEVKKLLKIGSKFNPNLENDVSSLFWVISFGWSIKSLVMDGIPSACSVILNATSSFEDVTNEIVQYANQWNTGFNGVLGVLSEPDTNVRIHQLYHQSCNEFGWWPTSTSRYHYFGKTIPLSYYVNICAKLFGDIYTEEYMQGKIDKFNEKYGGRYPNVENIFFTQSIYDSYRSLTHRKAIVFPDAIFGNYFVNSTSNDSPQLQYAREHISKSIANIINENESFE